MREKLNTGITLDGRADYRVEEQSDLDLRGEFSAICHGWDGEFLWESRFPNTVTTQGKNLLLDTTLAGAAYTVTGPYVGLISSVSFTAIAAADTQLSHTGWLECGTTNAPTYTVPRKTAVWSAAAAGVKALSAGLVFSFTGTGSVVGAFIVFGTGASATVMNTGGALLSAGLFSVAKTVGNGDTITVSYSLSA